MNGLGITPNSIQAITCPACHDPHTPGIRFEDSTGMLAAGFSVQGAGAGALCMVCHNSRNGARGDLFNGVYTNFPLPGLTPADGANYFNVTSIGAPHEAAQTDVYAGQNAFYVGSSPSRHMAVSDTCVGCHMQTTPEFFPDGVTLYKATNTNHTWHIDTTICAECHGAAGDVNGEGLQAQFDAEAADLLNAMTAKSLSILTASRYFAIKGTLSTQYIDLTVNPITALTVTTGRTLTLNITFTTAITNPDAASPATIGAPGAPYVGGLTKYYASADGATLGAAIFNVMTGSMAKANWNYSLVTLDSSRSIHNPSFVFEILRQTQTHLANDAVF
jgi:hypothetical protein